MRKENCQRNCIGAAVAAALFCIAGPVSGQDASQRVGELEEAVKELTKEIDSLKGQVNDNKDKTATVQQKVDTSVPTASLGEGVGFSDPRGNWALRFNGRIQGDYRTYDPNGISASTFGLRRARIGMALTVLKDYQMYVEGEFINGAATGTTTQTAALTNGWLDAAWFKAARVRIGQFKPQFGFENSMPDVLTDFQERALTQSLLQNLNYDRGIMVHGAPINGMYYGVTISNGAGLNLEESQGNTAEARADGKDVSVRLVQNFAEFLDVPDFVLHFGGSYKTGTVTTRGGTAFSPATVQTEARGITFFNTAALSGTDIDRTISALESTVAYGPVKIQGEQWRAEYEGVTTPGGVAYDRKLDAYYVSLGWMITGEAYADSYRGGVYGRLRPRNNFSMEDGGGWGAWEFAARYSKFDGGDFTTTNAAGTGVLGAGAATLSPPVTVSTNKADAYTVQLKWMPNAYTRFLVNYVQTNFDTPVTANGQTTDDEKAITLRAQFDF
ncbi:MAG TPA: porin [Burkholderiales bacterium]|nr:porin [Burkholderiales bacterium]